MGRGPRGCGVLSHFHLIGSEAAGNGIGHRQGVGTAFIYYWSSSIRSGNNVRAAPSEAHVLAHAGAVQLNLATRSASDLGIGTRVRFRIRGSADHNGEYCGALVGIGHRHLIVASRYVREVRSGSSGAPQIAVTGCSTGAAHRCASVARTARGGRGLDVAAHGGGLANDELTLG